jgi:hypothetical protein
MRTSQIGGIYLKFRHSRGLNERNAGSLVLDEWHGLRLV